MFSTSDFRKNLKIEYEGDPYVIIEAQHVKPGKGVAFVKTRMKNLLNGRVLFVNFRSGDKVGRPDIREREMQYIYQEGEFYVFMDTNSYEQVRISAEALSEVLPYMKEEMECTVLFYGENPINVEIANFVVLRVTQTDPGVKGDTASGGSKPATLETGHVVQVPLYLEENELIRIDTRSGEYVERAKE